MDFPGGDRMLDAAPEPPAESPTSAAPTGCLKQTNKQILSLLLFTQISIQYVCTHQTGSNFL